MYNALIVEAPLSEHIHVPEHELETIIQQLLENDIIMLLSPWRSRRVDYGVTPS